ncbi:hypothetical protein LCGC14_2413430 [marine sediment metagenome]|uniref:Uncharacterized protein n=1 Tax=marine sediment metagenome TaxID=412755 RepID=A0A0F9E3Y8_9ZZZZ
MTVDRKIDDDHVGVKYDEVVFSKEELKQQKAFEEKTLTDQRQQVTLSEARLAKINMRLDLLKT